MSHVAEITNYDQQTSFINNNPKGIIFFGSSRCHHCADMIPVVQDLSQKYPSVAFAHVETTKVKVDNVDGVPVFVAYKSSVPIDVLVGADDEKLRDIVHIL